MSDDLEAANVEFTVSMKNNYEFRRLYSKGKSAATSRIVIYCRPMKRPKSHLGITVSTKLGKAVRRNRVRRRLKEIYRLNECRLAPGYDIVLVARVRSVDAEYRRLEADFLYLAEKLGLMKQE